MQVQLNSLADTLPGAAAEAEQAILQAQVEGAISAAFSSLVDEQSCFMQEPCQQPGGLSLLQHVSHNIIGQSMCQHHWSEPMCQLLCWGCVAAHPKQVCTCVLVQGDDCAAAACGLTTGYVHSPDSSKQSAALSQPAGAAHSSAQQQGRSTSDWGFAAGGLSSQDVDAVERHMLQLLQVHGLAAADAQQDMESDAAFDPAVERQLQQAELKVGSHLQRRLGLADMLTSCSVTVACMVAQGWGGTLFCSS